MIGPPAPARRLALAMAAAVSLSPSVGHPQGIHSRIENIAATACYYHVRAKYGSDPEWVGWDLRWPPSGFIGTYRYRVEGQAMPVICKFDENKGVRVT